MNKMLKFKILTMVLMFAIPSFAMAQQSITVVKLSNGGRYLEITNQGFLSTGSAYYMGPSATGVLIQSIKKAMEWHDLNQSHRMSFTKEINRFKIMDKTTYESFGYTSSLSKNAKVIFKAYSDGSSECQIATMEGGNYDMVFITLSGRESMQQFLNILQGKSARPEIDNIFRN